MNQLKIEKINLEEVLDTIPFQTMNGGFFNNKYTSEIKDNYRICMTKIPLIPIYHIRIGKKDDKNIDSAYGYIPSFPYFEYEIYSKTLMETPDIKNSYLKLKEDYEKNEKKWDEWYEKRKVLDDQKNRKMIMDIIGVEKEHDVTLEKVIDIANKTTSWERELIDSKREYVGYTENNKGFSIYIRKKLFRNKYKVEVRVDGLTYHKFRAKNNEIRKVYEMFKSNYRDKVEEEKMKDEISALKFEQSRIKEFNDVLKEKIKE